MAVDERTTELSVNGVLCRARATPDLTLLAYLREDLGLTGAKLGCGQGHCGACTVIVNGEARRACLLRVARLQGARIETIESLSTADYVHALQYAFLKQGAVQCGFCTPGMILAAKALLDRNPNPDDAAIRQALAHNLCRCTGYAKILAAVREAAALMRRGQTRVPRRLVQELQQGGVGARAARLDGLERVTGALAFTADLSFPGQLYGRVLRSPYPHAEILSLDTTEAAQMPGVVAVLTAADVPGAPCFGLIVADQPVLASDCLRYVGDAVAAVYAETPGQAEAALARIDLRCRELPVVDAPEAALRPDAPRVHPEGNLLSEMHVRKGDAGRGLAEADVIVEGTYRVPAVDHAYLEPEACVAAPDGDGVVVYVGSQGPSLDRKQVSASLDLPPERVRVVHMPVGGAFGGKEDITLQILAALGALRTGRPVKMVMSRAESLCVSTKRHAQVLHYRTGATRDGRLTAMEVTIHADTGAYASLGPAVLQRSSTFACGPYNVPNVRVDAYLAYTNNVPAGAMRGFGSPQVAFAAESQMDELARRLGMDPFALRELNALEAGVATATGDVLAESVGVRETLAAVRRALVTVEVPEPQPGKRIGVGVAASYKNVGLGGEGADESEAVAELDAGGALIVRTGCADLGQGAATAMAQIAAEAGGVPLRGIRVHLGDTRLDPPGAMTTASRETFISGNAVLAAVRCWRELALAAAAGETGLPRASLALEDGWFTAPGKGRVLGLAELAERLQERGERLEARAHYVAPPTHAYRPVPEAPYDRADYAMHFAYCFGTQAAIVQVDETTGEVEVLRLIAAHDAGRIVNPLAVEGQIEGGVMMGLGYALSECFEQRQGQVVTDTLRKEGVPGISRLPEVTTLLIENPHSQGPFGAKGMAELPAAATAPAIVNAIRDALGVRIYDLPAMPARILAALEAAQPGS